MSRWTMGPHQLLCGDALETLRTLPSSSAQTCITSPPYWNLRDYGVPGQMGQEESPRSYAEAMVAIFREVRRVLRDDGTLWLNLGDSFASRSHDGIKAKNLLGIPWRVAFALQDDGWFLRSDIVWAKPNPMPESVRDRPTRAHEYIFLLSKSPRYHYDGAAIREPAKEASIKRIRQAGFAQQTGGPKDYAKTGVNESRSMRRVLENFAKQDKQRGHGRRHDGFNDRWGAMSKDEQQAMGANKRDVWTVATRPYPDAHFATFPPALIEPCVLAGAPEDGVVLDPFCGTGTTLAVAHEHGRVGIGIELNPEYCQLALRRVMPLVQKTRATQLALLDDEIAS